MKTIHIEKHEQCRQIAEREGYRYVMCIKENLFCRGTRKVGETFCSWQDDEGRWHVFASWTPDSFLYVLSDDQMRESFVLLV